MKIFLTIALLFSIQVMAAEIKLAQITSQFDQDTAHYYVEVNEKGEIESMRYITILPSGAVFNDVSLTVESVMAEGAVIVVRDGHEAVRLELENFNPKTGGTVKLNYLFNGATGRRHIKRFELSLLNNQFHLFDLEKPINRMFFVANRIRVLGIVGIKEIKSSFVSQHK